MKKNIIFPLLGIFLSIASLSNAQQFWIEKWTGSTAQGQTTYTGPNGAWNVVRSGANGADSNVWYFSNWEEGMGRGQCGAGQTGPASAHMGFTRKSPLDWPVYQILNSATNPDQGAVIDDDRPDPTNTNLRLQSPLINCTGKTNIKLSFNYIEGKADGNTAEATVMYSSNGGTTWSLLSTPPELDSCNTGEGHWTYYTVALPASANGNANVKIGFNWTNGMLEHEDSIFDNYSVPVVSFAVDSIALSTSPSTVPVAKFTETDTLICVGDTVHFTDLSTNTPTSWKWTFEGGNPGTSTLQNPTVVYSTPGTDSVKLVVKNSSGSDSVTRKLCIYVLARPSAIISGADSICKGDTDILTASGGTVYLWSNGRTTSTIRVNPVNTTIYSVMVGNGACSVSDSVKVNVKNCRLGIADIADNNTISLYPNPANNTINLAFTKAIAENAKIDITDITGRLISTQMVNTTAGKTITMNISGIANGMYIVKVTAGSNAYFEKFIKQ